MTAPAGHRPRQPGPRARRHPEARRHYAFVYPMDGLAPQTKLWSRSTPPTTRAPGCCCTAGSCTSTRPARRPGRRRALPPGPARQQSAHEQRLRAQHLPPRAPGAAPGGGLPPPGAHGPPARDCRCRCCRTWSCRGATGAWPSSPRTPSTTSCPELPAAQRPYGAYVCVQTQGDDVTQAMYYRVVTTRYKSCGSWWRGLRAPRAGGGGIGMPDGRRRRVPPSPADPQTPPPSLALFQCVIQPRDVQLEFWGKVLLAFGR